MTDNFEKCFVIEARTDTGWCFIWASHDGVDAINRFQNEVKDGYFAQVRLVSPVSKAN